MASTVDPLDLINIEQRLFTLEANTNKFNLNRSENLRRVQEQTKNCYTEIRAFRKDVNTFLDKIEQAFCQELWSLEVEQRDNILYVVHELEKVNHAVITLKATLREIKNGASNAYNESFEKLKKELCENENSVYIKLFNSSGGRELDLNMLLNPELQTLTSKIQSLGDVYFARGPSRIEFDEKNTFMVDTEMTKESQSEKNDREDGNKEEGRKDVSTFIFQSQEDSELICKVKQEPIEDCPITTEPLPSNMSVHVSSVTQSQGIPVTMVTCTTPYFIRPLLTSAIHAPIVMPAKVSSAPTMQFPVPIQSGNNRAPATFQLPSGSNVQSSLMAAKQPYLIRFMPIDMNSKIIRRFPLVPVMPASTNAPTCTSTGNQLPETQLQMALQSIDQPNHPYLSPVNEPGNIQNIVAIQTDSELKQYDQQLIKLEPLSPQPCMSPESEQPPSVEELLSEIEKNNEDDQPSTKKRGRFQRMTDEDMEELQETNFESKSTQANTRWGVKMFQEWSKETSGEDTDLENISAEDLNEKLKYFYAETKPMTKANENISYRHVNPTIYKKHTMKNARAALNRYFKNIKRDFDIVRDSAFKESNALLDAKIKILEKKGLLSKCRYRENIDKEELKLLCRYVYRSNCNALSLRQSVWFCITINFLSLTKENQKQLKIDSFDFNTDADGTEYVVINRETINLFNCQDLEKERMCASPWKAFCPIAGLRLLIRKTDPKADFLFNCLSREVLTSTIEHKVDIWYYAKTVSKRTFNLFMSDICKSAGCRSLYSSGCLRDTALFSNQDPDLRALMYNL
ncbi:uncharacterized protein LOC127707827 isoform X1 [Mytilus californianus]|uniref:uncharacterized protein LOC127707827 isoform X1 n=1 Tax=Mytilus californianus TaxID=6549 RepID=UPI0022455599|nr:uncharacterized protein LOC127707827 isoform X1 [Mytilus californianus]